MTNLKPTGPRLLIQRQVRQNISAGGLHLPEQAKEKPPYRGVVLAKGDDVAFDGKDILYSVKVGDHVLFAGGYDFELEGQQVYMIRMDELLGVFKE